MQEKTLLKPKIRTSNIHSSEFGSVSYDIFGSPYQKSGSFLADDSLDFGYLGKPYNGETELYDFGFRDYSSEIARFTTVDHPQTRGFHYNKHGYSDFMFNLFFGGIWGFGNSHDSITPDAQVSYSSLSDADTYCNQMNNELGRSLGKESNLSNKDLALKVLDYFHESGLYTVSQSTDGGYSVNLTKISDEEYETAYSEISKRNNQGLLK